MSPQEIRRSLKTPESADTRAQFIREIPIGTTVQYTLTKDFGITLPGRIYKNVFDNYVHVGGVNGIPDQFGIWDIAHVVKI